MFEEAETKFGAGHPQTLNPLGELGANLLEQKKFDEAEPLLRKGLAGREKHEPDAWTTSHTRMQLGVALVGPEEVRHAARNRCCWKPTRG